LEDGKRKRASLDGNLFDQRVFFKEMIHTDSQGIFKIGGAACACGNISKRD